MNQNDQENEHGRKPKHLCMHSSTVSFEPVRMIFINTRVTAKSSECLCRDSTGHVSIPYSIENIHFTFNAVLQLLHLGKTSSVTSHGMKTQWNYRWNDRHVSQFLNACSGSIWKFTRPRLNLHTFNASSVSIRPLHPAANIKASFLVSITSHSRRTDNAKTSHRRRTASLAFVTEHKCRRRRIADHAAALHDQLLTNRLDTLGHLDLFDQES